MYYIGWHNFWNKKNCTISRIFLLKIYSSFFIAQLLLEERWAHCGNGSMLPETDSCLNQRLENEIIEKLIFPFNKFDLTALELKPFTRFTIAKSLDDLTEYILVHSWGPINAPMGTMINIDIQSPGP